MHRYCRLKTAEPYSEHWESQVEFLSWLQVDVAEAEEMGLWLRLTRDGVPRLLMLRWDYILAVDVIAKVEVLKIGLRHN